MEGKYFKNRQDAGRALAKKLKRYQNTPQLLILGLPRGGVPIAYEVAKALHAPLDVLIVRKIGAPGQKEFAIGAISKHASYFNQATIASLGLTPNEMKLIVREEQLELHRRETLYRNNQPPLEIKHKTILLIDDGIATGATVMAAIHTLQKQSPKAIVLAIPVASKSTCNKVAPMVKELICLNQPEHFTAVGAWYEDFTQTTDAEVLKIMQFIKT